MTEGRSALLVMDVMPVLIPAFGGDSALLKRLASAAEAARRAGISVIHTRVQFRTGCPDVAPANKVFSAVTASLDFTEDNPDTNVHPALGVQGSDIIITKRRVSAFAGSDLELVLRSGGIETLVLAGVTTSGVVLSTLRQAADLDYRIIVLSDGCADSNPGVHQTLLNDVFPAHAEVTTISDWAAGLPS